MVTKPVENVAVSVLRKLQTIAVDDPEFPRGRQPQRCGANLLLWQLFLKTT